MQHIRMIQMSDFAKLVNGTVDLNSLRTQLKTLASMIEWEYPLSYQRDIDKVVHLLNRMIKDAK